MKKWSVILTIIFVLTLAACENKENDIQTTDGKHITSASSNASSSTTKTETETSTENSKKAVANKSTSVKQSVATNQNKSQTTSAAAQTTVTKNNSTTAAVTKQAEYTPEAWGTTTAQMEAELSEYAQSIGMVYDSSFTLESGHWITPTASNLFNSWNEYKSKLCESIYYYHTVSGYSEVRVIFQYTTTTLRDGSTVKCMDAYIVVK